jgi:hypothetical protein
MAFDVHVTQTAGPPIPAGTAFTIDVRAVGAAPHVVVAPADLTYLGYGLLPLDDGAAGTRFGFSTGALSGRVVDGAIHLFVTQATQETGWPDPVAEVHWRGVGERMALVANHGDITQGRRVSAAGNPKPIRGLLWDPATEQLLWAYMDAYNVTCAHDPCLGATRLGAAVTVAGPWRLREISQKTGGYLAAIPAAWRAAFGGQFLAGAPLGSGDAGSPFGAFAEVFTLPDAATPPDTTTDDHVTIPSTTALYSDINHRQARRSDVDECSWDHYGESNEEGNQPQWNPTQDGRGCTVDGDLCGVQCGPIHGVFTHVDRINAMAWIDGPTKQGLVCIGQLARTMAAHVAEYGAAGRCHCWYGPAQEYGVRKLCPHGQNDTRYTATATAPGVTTMQAALFIYDPAVLAGVVAGASPIGVVPTTDAYDLSAIAAEGAPFPALATAQDQFGGAWFEPINKLLFVTATRSEWSGEWRPVVHAFKVAC